MPPGAFPAPGQVPGALSGPPGPGTAWLLLSPVPGFLQVQVLPTATRSTFPACKSAHIAPYFTALRRL